ncbi:MAG: hypothetical protein HFJ95_02325 [Muribaculaceae bacterium]|nr:hypothetical protein [Muribaculaceae bacterium]
MKYRTFIAMLLSVTSMLTAFGKTDVLEVSPLFTDRQVAGDTTCFRSVAEALREAERLQKVHAYSEESPLTIRIAPSVYWLDDPDDPTVRNPSVSNGTPFGMELQLSHIRLLGLSDNAEDVVLACNRGQTQGANGNFTMLHLIGSDISVENITFGNYCNVDLVYPRDPSLNRPRREDAIVQAQLIICDGDRVVARNCRFISRLNLCPFAGAKRALFDNCYFECTDDALCGTGVYYRCRFTLFSGKPFYNTYAQGARFLDCDLHALTSGRQYLVKVGSQVAMVDCRWTSADPSLSIAWTQDPTDDLRSYQSNLTLNGEPLFINRERPHLTVDMTGKSLLDAYKSGDTYNIYNLLKGDDGWNPTRQDTASLPSQPTRLTLSHRKAAIETGKDSVCLSADSPDVDWLVDDTAKRYVRLTPMPLGKCVVEGLNTGEEAVLVPLTARTPAGLEAGCVLTVNPPILPAPDFTSYPRLSRQGDRLKVDYTLSLNGRADLSEVTWYRSKSPNGTDAIPVAVSRHGAPKLTYTLTEADCGYHIMAAVAPRHIRSGLGTPVTAITPEMVAEAPEVKELQTDFSDFPTSPQLQIIPGFWTVDAVKPADTAPYDWSPDPLNGWYYGTGMDGAAGIEGLLQASRGARLIYNPVRHSCGDMQLSLLVDPCKSAGQGFGSATGQYMDICIKFDPVTLSGYALRIIRTTKNDKAVDFLLLRYDNGVATPISAPVSAICYRSGCEINLSATGNTLTASVNNRSTLPEPHREGLSKDVYLSATITPTAYGGICIQHTGSTGASATLLRELNARWSE